IPTSLRAGCGRAEGRRKKCQPLSMVTLIMSKFSFVGCGERAGGGRRTMNDLSASTNRALCLDQWRCRAIRSRSSRRLLIVEIPPLDEPFGPRQPVKWITGVEIFRLEPATQPSFETANAETAPQRLHTGRLPHGIADRVDLAVLIERVGRNGHGGW